MITKRWVLSSIVVVGTLAAAGAVAVAVGRFAWNRETARAFAGLPESSARGDESSVLQFSNGEIGGLPDPVGRYFALVLPEGQQRIRSAAIEWAGEFQMRPNGGWAPFEATQRFTSQPPGFVWDARIRMMPLLSAHVRDSYLNGTGTMQARLGGLVSVVDEGGTPEMAQSALARWLGEAAWFPTALLPGASVRWEAVDDSTARATVLDGTVSASAEFTFAPTGEMTRMTALRYRNVDGTAVLTEFEGVYGEYVRHEGVLVPGSAEVAWLLPEGRYPYWQGRPVRIEYESLAYD